MSSSISIQAPYSNKNYIDYTNLEIVFSDYLDKKCWLTSDPTKSPFNPHTNTREWGCYDNLCDFKEIQQFLSNHPNYLPCIIPAAAGLTAIDLDKVKNPSEDFPTWVEAMAIRFGSYCETSQSSTGLHIIILEDILDGYAVGSIQGCKIEFIANHPLTLTGNIFKNFDTLKESGFELKKLYQEVITVQERQFTFKEPISPSMSDETVLDLCYHFENQDKFKALFNRGELAAYNFDHSSADIALCGLLAFFTQNSEQIDRLFQQSALHQNPDRIAKWSRLDYKTATIRKAIEGCYAYYQPKKINTENQIGSWENPLSIEQGEDTELNFPLEVLPGCLRTAAEEVGRFAHADPALAIVPGMGMAGLQIGKKILIEEKPGLEHHPSTITVGAVDSGERKSSIENAMLGDIKEAIENELPEYQKQVSLVNTHNELISDRISALKKKLKEGALKHDQALAEINELKATIKPELIEPINFADDITAARLFQKLHKHGGAYGIFSADARKLFNRLLGRGDQNGMTSEDIYISASWGDTIHRSRVTGKDAEGEDLFIGKPALTISALVQRDLWKEFLGNKTMRES